MTEEATGLLSAVRKGLPFARFDPGSVIGNGVVPVIDMTLLALGTAAILLMAVWAFDRKQVAG